jgi:hypothetical protein
VKAMTDDKVGLAIDCGERIQPGERLEEFEYDLIVNIVMVLLLR